MSPVESSCVLNVYDTSVGVDLRPCFASITYFFTTIIAVVMKAALWILSCLHLIFSTFPFHIPLAQGPSLILLARVYRGSFLDPESSEKGAVAVRRGHQTGTPRGASAPEEGKSEDCSRLVMAS